MGTLHLIRSMKTFTILLAVCVLGLAVAKPAASSNKKELENLLKSFLNKGTTSLSKRCGKDSGEVSGEDKPKKPFTTMFAGLGVDEIIKPKPLSEEDLDFLQSVVKMSDLEDLGNYLMAAAADMAAISTAFLEAFKAENFTPESTFDDISATFEALYVNVILPKELDMEGMKEYVDGMVARIAIAGTDRDFFAETSEPGCLKENGKMDLRCVLGKFKFLEIAAGIYEFYSIAALDNETHPIELCDDVFVLPMGDPAAITAQSIAAALVGMGECMEANSVKIETRLTPDQINPETGEPYVPMMPLPRMLALQAKMGIHEYMGMIGVHSYFALAQFYEASQAQPVATKALDQLRALLKDIKTKAKMDKISLY